MPKIPVNDALLRSCCLEFLERYSGPTDEGAVAFCDHCVNRMRIHNGVWVFYPHKDTRMPEGGRWEELSARWNRDQTAR